MAAIVRFEDIEAWQRARQLTREVYELTRSREFSRDYGLVDQMRRAAVSGMSNIAEGFERGGNREFQHFLAIAKASSGELRSQLYVALDVGYIDLQQFQKLQALTVEVSRLVAGFMRYLATSPLEGAKHRNEPLVAE
jgi:four helix bundle protein